MSLTPPRTTVAIASLFIAGCAVGSDYSRPALPLPQAWVAPIPQSTAHDGSTARLADWWALWDDPVLVELIDNAQNENANILVAAARIAAARATVTGVAAPFWPAAEAKASDNRSRANQGGN